jgi:hypothetical protein
MYSIRNLDRDLHPVWIVYCVGHSIVWRLVRDIRASRNDVHVVNQASTTYQSQTSITNTFTLFG